MVVAEVSSYRGDKLFIDIGKFAYDESTVKRKRVLADPVVLPDEAGSPRPCGVVIQHDTISKALKVFT